VQLLSQEEDKIKEPRKSRCKVWRLDRYEHHVDRACGTFLFMLKQRKSIGKTCLPSPLARRKIQVASVFLVWVLETFADIIFGFSMHQSKQK
jgi:hypothetical protein